MNSWTLTKAKSNWDVFSIIFRWKNNGVTLARNQVIYKINLKILTHLLINKTQFQKHQNSENEKCFAIVITVGNSMKISKLYSKGVRFSSTLKIIKIYWKTEISLIFITCSAISYN